MTKLSAFLGSSLKHLPPAAVVSAACTNARGVVRGVHTRWGGGLTKEEQVIVISCCQNQLPGLCWAFHRMKGKEKNEGKVPTAKTEAIPVLGGWNSAHRPGGHFKDSSVTVRRDSNLRVS